jgi:pimeloyl-ACP methyl ester carboxylesterase
MLWDRFVRIALASTALAVLAGFAPGPASAATVTPTPAPSPLNQVGCPFLAPEGQEEGESYACFALTVPENRLDPKSQTIDLMVAIFLPEGASSVEDPIITVTGGPGGSDLKLLDLLYEDSIAPRLAGGRPLVVYDQRGTGFSEPSLSCTAADKLAADLLDNRVAGKRLTPVDARARLASAVSQCRAGLAKVADLRSYTTDAHAADLVDLVEALDVGPVSLWASGYGARIALEALHKQPDLARSVLLESAGGPLPASTVERFEAAATALDGVFEACAADAACDEVYPDLADSFANTVAGLDEEPHAIDLLDPVGNQKITAELSGAEFARALLLLLQSSEALRYVPIAIAAAAEGNYDIPAAMLGAYTGAMQRGLSSAARWSISCRETPPTADAKALSALSAAYPALAGLFEKQLADDQKICSAWQEGPTSRLVMADPETDAPVLFMSGAHDPVAPFAWAEETAASLPNAMAIEVPATSHDPADARSCPRELALAFLADPDETLDTSCLDGISLRFTLPVSAPELAPYASDGSGWEGVAPVGWIEIGDGEFQEKEDPDDPTILTIKSGLMGAEDMLRMTAERLGLEQVPEPVGQLEAGILTWDAFTVEQDDRVLDFAIADQLGYTLRVLLVSEPGERDVLFEQLMLPVVDETKPLPETVQFMKDSKPMADAAAAWIGAVVAGNYKAAYALLHPELQRKIGSQAAFRKMLADASVFPETHVFTDRSMDGATGELSGTVSDADGAAWEMDLALIRQSGKWLLTRFNFSPAN